MRKTTASACIIWPQGMTIKEYREYVYRQIEMAGRTCYKSDPDTDITECERFVRQIVRAGHGAMLEHVSLTVIFTVDRGITHELVRHRMASFAQESTRYCNYSGDKFGNAVTFIDLRPGMEIDPKTSVLSADDFEAIYDEWIAACEDAERHYMAMLKRGASPQIARSVLPNSHILSLRALGTTGAPHPQMKEVMGSLLGRLTHLLPACFDDLAMEQ